MDERDDFLDSLTPAQIALVKKELIVRKKKESMTSFLPSIILISFGIYLATGIPYVFDSSMSEINIFALIVVIILLSFFTIIFLVAGAVLFRSALHDTMHQAYEEMKHDGL